MREIVAEAWEPVLRPLVYKEAVTLAEQHLAAGRPVYVVSAALHEVVQEVASRLAFSGALGSRAEVEDGAYTGRLLERLFGEAKARAVVELATREDLDLGASHGYSDSHSDVPFLAVVGHPVAVNPDRDLRRVAAARGWPVERFRSMAYPR
jgi:HAD superfamily hydrolase (TIGR01490 family)